MMLGIAAAVIAVAVALLVARVPPREEVARDRPPRPEPDVTQGGLQVTPLQGWKPAAAAPALPGLDFSEPVVLEEPVSNMVLVAGLLPATSPTLLPQGLIASLQAPLEPPSTVGLSNGVEAYHHADVALEGRSGALDLYLVPTTAGILTAACVADGEGDHGGAPFYDCWKNVATLRLDAARALRLGPDAGFRVSLPGVIEELDAARASARRGLAGRIPTEQASSASELAAAYDRAAGALRPLAPRSPIRARRIVAQLTALADAYRSVVAPLRESDPVGYARGRSEVRAREQRLERQIAGTDRT
jgi:hypothetical protein